MDASRVKQLLGLEPLTGEGGFFYETYRSGERIPRSALSSRYPGDRSFGTAIYYLVTPESFSALHRVPGDELFHFYLGDPVIMLRLYPDGAGDTAILGNDIEEGQLLQSLAPGGVWQGLRLTEGGRFALLGTTMSPGFEFEDYEQGDRATLQREYPAFAEMIERFTR